MSRDNLLIHSATVFVNREILLSKLLFRHSGSATCQKNNFMGHITLCKLPSGRKFKTPNLQCLHFNLKKKLLVTVNFQYVFKAVLPVFPTTVYHHYHQTHGIQNHVSTDVIHIWLKQGDLCDRHHRAFQHPHSRSFKCPSVLFHVLAFSHFISPLASSLYIRFLLICTSVGIHISVISRVYSLFIRLSLCSCRLNALLGKVEWALFADRDVIWREKFRLG